VPPTAYSVTYNGNTNSGGAAPSDGNAYVGGATVTVAGNTGSLTKAGYSFDGWCTTQPAAGSACAGTSRAAASTFAISANTVLYAVWSDTTAPSVSSLSPVDDATGIAVDANLVITFSENVTAVAGKYVRVCTGTATCTGSSVAGDVVQVLEATNAAITISSAQVTINPAADLSSSTVHYVSIDAGAFRDAASNAYAGLAAGASWNFTTVTCAQGGVCAVGDTGPGGGTVFYVHSSGTFSCGRARTSTCKYLEYAPTSGASAWTDVGVAWSGNTTSAVGSEAQRTDIGTGYSNTLAVINDNSTADRAATAAGAFRGPNNQSDWHLPARLELNELCKYARQQTTGDSSVNCANTGTLRSGFQTGAHWSSTEVDATQARTQGFTSGTQSQTTKTTALWVRPIRAFGGTLACADGGTCAVGDTGPGGGIVFYVASSNFTSTGSDCGASCRYLEVAPAASEAGRSWATGANQSAAVTGADATGIGSGYQNTVDVNAQAGNVAATSAAVYAFDYTNNGKTDWHLASREELNELCKYARQQTTGDTSVACANTDSLRAGFAGAYWSSSEGAADIATIRDFDTGQIVANNKSFDRKARPIRAFG
jgi:hypothetical protein